MKAEEVWNMICKEWQLAYPIPITSQDLCCRQGCYHQDEIPCHSSIQDGWKVKQYKWAPCQMWWNYIYNEVLIQEQKITLSQHLAPCMKANTDCNLAKNFVQYAGVLSFRGSLSVVSSLTDNSNSASFTWLASPLVAVTSNPRNWRRFKAKSIRKLSNFNFQWTKTLYQNNLTNIALSFTFFKGYRYNKLSVVFLTPKTSSHGSLRK